MKFIDRQLVRIVSWVLVISQTVLFSYFEVVKAFFK